MTAIAFKDGFLAADRGHFTSGGLFVGLASKITKLGPKRWIASAGEGIAGTRAERLFSVTIDPDLVDLQACGSCDGILVDAGRVYTFDTQMGIERMLRKYGACGTAHEYLIGALDAGASASQAVWLACKNFSGCRGPVDVIRVR